MLVWGLFSNYTVFRKERNAQLLEQTFMGAGLKRTRYNKLNNTKMHPNHLQTPRIIHQKTNHIPITCSVFGSLDAFGYEEAWQQEEMKVKVDVFSTEVFSYASYISTLSVGRSVAGQSLKLA